MAHLMRCAKREAEEAVVTLASLGIFLDMPTNHPDLHAPRFRYNTWELEDRYNMFPAAFGVASPFELFKEYPPYEAT